MLHTPITASGWDSAWVSARAGPARCRELGPNNNGAAHEERRGDQDRPETSSSCGLRRLRSLVEWENCLREKNYRERPVCRGTRARRGELNYGSRRLFVGRDGTCDGEKQLGSSELAPTSNAARNREGKRGKRKGFKHSNKIKQTQFKLKFKETTQSNRLVCYMVLKAVKKRI